MTKERLNEIVNSLIDCICIGEKLDYGINTLLDAGITKYELINDFGFSKSDVEKVIADRRY